MKEILREDFLTGKPRLVNMNQLGEALHQLKNPRFKACMSIIPTPRRWRRTRVRS